MNNVFFNYKKYITNLIKHNFDWFYSYIPNYQKNKNYLKLVSIDQNFDIKIDHYLNDIYNLLLKYNFEADSTKKDVIKFSNKEQIISINLKTKKIYKNKDNCFSLELINLLNVHSEVSDILKNIHYIREYTIKRINTIEEKTRINLNLIDDDYLNYIKSYFLDIQNFDFFINDKNTKYACLKITWFSNTFTIIQLVKKNKFVKKAGYIYVPFVKDYNCIDYVKNYSVFNVFKIINTLGNKKHVIFNAGLVKEAIDIKKNIDNF